MSFRVVHRPLATSFFFGLFAHSHTSSKRRRDAVKKETDLFVPFSRSFRFFRLFFSTFRVADCSALRNRTARLATSRDTFARALFDRRSARLSGSVRAKNFGFRVSTRVRGAFGDREDAHLVSRLFRGGPRRNLRKPTVGGAVFRRPRPLRPLFRFLRRKVVGVGDVGAKQ